MCVFAWLWSDQTWWDTLATSLSSSIKRGECERKMTSKRGNQQEVQTSLGAGIHRTRGSETVAPPGCGTREPQTGAFVARGTTVLYSKDEGRIRNLFLSECAAGWLICSLLLQMAMIALSLSSKPPPILLPNLVQCSFFNGSQNKAAQRILLLHWSRQAK